MRKYERHTQAEMYGHIENCKLSKQSQRAYCKEHGLAYTTFQYWGKKYRKEPNINNKADTVPGFIPVRVQPDFQTNQAHIPGQLHFLMPNGVQVLCPETVQPQVLHILLNP
jgi:hypothetical protein